jgi:hypothetical protein
MMIIRHLLHPGSRGSWVAVIMFLCLCVIMQMLGAPVTLLDPSLSPDTLGASVLEGFSVPPAVPQLTRSSETAPVIDAQPSVHVPLLAFALFHPPVL